MLSVYNIKPAFQRFLKPVLIWLHSLGITANQITASSILLSLSIGVSFWFADVYNILFLSLPVGLFIRMALNALDGMMARKFDQQTKSGEILNELGDVISDLFIYFPLIKYQFSIVYMIVVFLCLSIINEFAGLLGKVISGERRYDGPMGKSDRAFLIGVYGLLAFFNGTVNEYMFYVFLLINILLMLSTYLRVKRTLNL